MSNIVYTNEERKENEVAARIIRAILNMDLSSLINLEKKLPSVSKKMTEAEYKKAINETAGILSDSDFPEDLRALRNFNRNKKISFDD